MRNYEAKAHREAAAWTHPIGTVVYVTRDNGEVQRTKTRSAAAVMGGSAVIWLEGIAGCYSLSRVRAADDFPKRIPRERAVAGLQFANAILDLEDDLRVEEQPDGFLAGMSGETDTTTVEPEVWQRWLELARAAAATKKEGGAT